MIDPKMFDRDKLVDALINTHHGNRNQWINLVEIVPDYTPSYADARPGARVHAECRVLFRLGESVSYLRWSAGPIQGYFWDIYGDDFKCPESGRCWRSHKPPFRPGQYVPRCGIFPRRRRINYRACEVRWERGRM